MPTFVPWISKIDRERLKRQQLVLKMGRFCIMVAEKFSRATFWWLVVKKCSFFHDKPLKSRPRKFFRDFGWIILIKKLTVLIRDINRTNSWTNQTCRGDKQCHWRKEQPDVTETPPKKNALLLTKYFWGDYHALKSSPSKYHGRKYYRTKDFPF